MSRWNLQDLYNKGLNVDLKTGIATQKKTKYKNAKIEVDGNKFDSTIERNFYNLLNLYKIEFTMKDVFVLQDKFRYLGEAVRDVKIVPDFVIRKNGVIFAIVDTKGMQTDKSKLQIKLLKNHLKEKQVPIFLPNNKTKSEETIRKILELIK
ncbi:MAG: DUF1064 domain-containing protein [Thiolinea sp.]